MRSGSTPRPSLTVLFVCLGNICRSPCFAAALRAEATRRGIAAEVRALSAGVAPWCGGKPVHRAMASAAATAGIDMSAHRSERVTARLLAEADLVMPLDAAVRDSLHAEFGRDELSALRMPAWLDLSVAEVPDPYGGPAEGFAMVVELASDAARRLCDRHGSVAGPVP